ncbi:MAG: hypothetical protein ACXWDB_08010 [Aeromicrobium sp.]
MPIFRRPRKDSQQFAADEVLWGVARREAASDRDDPILHSGLIQHAFVLGNDEQAVCGFRPPVSPGFGGRTRVPQLALPGPDNPQCSKCLELLARAVRAQVNATASWPGSESGQVSTDPIDDDALEATVSIEADSSPDAAGLADEQEETESARDETRPPRRSSVRRAGRITVPQGRRSIVTHLPVKWHGAAITADVDGSIDDLRVQSVRVVDDGTVRITLNQRTSAPVDLVLYLVSGPQHP